MTLDLFTGTITRPYFSRNAISARAALCDILQSDAEQRAGLGPDRH